MKLLVLIVLMFPAVIAQTDNSCAYPSKKENGTYSFSDSCGLMKGDTVEFRHTHQKDLNVNGRGLPSASPSLIRSAEFGVYVAVSVVMHAAIALPALLLRVCTDFWMSKSIIQAIKPVKRGDLY